MNHSLLPSLFQLFFSDDLNGQNPESSASFSGFTLHAVHTRSLYSYCSDTPNFHQALFHHLHHFLGVPPLSHLCPSSTVVFQNLLHNVPLLCCVTSCGELPHRCRCYSHHSYSMHLLCFSYIFRRHIHPHAAIFPWLFWRVFLSSSVKLLAIPQMP